MTEHYADDTVTVHHGDCLDVLATLPDASVDAVVTDPPYGLEFMGKEWDRFDEDSKARAGMSATGYTDGAERLQRPSHLGGLNPKCRTCQKWQRGGNPCTCDSPDFPNERRARSAAFGDWCQLWATECLRVLKPGGHLLAFGGTRTSHRLTCAIEDAGFEIRDSIAWLYGSGFPKSLDVSKAIDKAAGAERDVVGRAQGAGNGSVVGLGSGRSMSSEYDSTAPATDAARTWQGWGTALKPAHEPVVVARKPLSGTVAQTVLEHGTGALNIAGCRVEADWETDPTRRGWQGGNSRTVGATGNFGVTGDRVPQSKPSPAGRWPANVVLDESQAAALDQQSGESVSKPNPGTGKPLDTQGMGWGFRSMPGGFEDSGGASRFFYTAKADAAERVRVDGTAHPTVKPLALMRWLVRLVTPPGGTVLEPFAGSGTTVEACILEGFRCVAIEREADYLPLILQRVHRRRDPVAAVKAAGDDGGLFDLLSLLGEEPA